MIVTILFCGALIAAYATAVAERKRSDNLQLEMGRLNHVN